MKRILTNLYPFSMKKPSKVNKSRPLYAKDPTIARVHKTKEDRKKGTVDNLLNYLLDVEKEVNRRK